MQTLNSWSKIIEEIQFRYRVACFNVFKVLKKAVTIQAKHGVFTLPMEIDDSICRWLYTRRHYEFDLIVEAMDLLRRLKPMPEGKGTLLDVGANNGVISIQMLNSGKLERSIAIEPAPKNFKSLVHNTRQNQLDDRMVCLNYAVSDIKGELIFELSEDNWGDHRVRNAISGFQPEEHYHESQRETIRVESDTLDNLLASQEDHFTQDISVLWVDVQGHEGYVFAGGKQILSKGIPAVSELWPYGIKRSGMSQDQFCEIVSEIWTHYWVKRRGKFVQYPIEMFSTFFDELGFDGDYDTVIFTRE